MANEGIKTLVSAYEQDKAEGKSRYWDGDELADITAHYAIDRRYAEAQEVINYGLRLHPHHTLLLIEQAYLYIDTSQLQAAQLIAETIADQTDAEVIMLKAEILLHMGLVDEAGRMLESLGEDDDMEIIISVCYLYMDMGYEELAYQWLKKGESRYAHSERYMAVMADYLLNSRQPDKGIEQFERLIDIDPYNSSYWMGLAKCRFLQDDYAATMEACDFALAANENEGEAYTYRAHCLSQLDNQEAAIVEYKRAIKHKGMLPEVGFFFIGNIHIIAERWEEAIQAFDEVILLTRQQPDNEQSSLLLADAYAQKAVVLAQLGDFDQAHELCNRARLIEPGETHFDLVEGSTYLADGKLAEAMALFFKALSNDKDTETYYTVASYLLEYGYVKEALPYFREIYAEDPAYKDVSEKIRLISIMLGQVNEFFFYNNLSPRPFGKEAIIDFMNHPAYADEIAKAALKEILKRMS